MMRHRPAGASSPRVVDPGLMFLGAAIIVFVTVAVPVISQGAPFMDDFVQCTAHENGMRTFLSQSFEDNGVVRPIRFAETLVINFGCNSMPFGLLIMLPMIFTIGAAVLLAGLLRDIGVGGSWSKVGGALILLYPIGAESALWPSAMHIPLGLATAIASLRSFRRGSWLTGSAAFLLSALCVEQMLFAVPFAVWALTPSSERRRSTLSSLCISAVVISAYAAFPGTQARTAVSIVDRLTAVFSDPGWYLRFPPNALGGRSVAFGIVWGFPWVVVLMGMGATVFGFRPAALLREGSQRSRDLVSPVLIGASLVVLVNVPIIVTLPRDSSPRLFTPTWVVVAGVLAVLGSRITVRQPRLVGGCVGLLLAVAVTAMAFTTWARVNTAEVTERAMRVIESQVRSGDTVVVCDVPSSGVDPAPVGLYSQTEFLVDWAATSALFHYADVYVNFIVDQSDADGVCGSGVVTADLVVTFEDLTRGSM